MNKADEATDLKTSIRRMLARVPNKVNAGGHTTAVAYKADAVEAGKEIAKSKTNLGKLRDIHNKLASYY